MKAIKARRSGLEIKRQRPGYWFVLPWVIGMLLFFIIPLFTSIQYSFSDVKIEPGEVIVHSVGFKNYNQILTVDADYVNQLAGSVGYVLGSVPLVIAFSLIIAVLLSRKFFARTFFRALYFSPIIFATSAVMKILENDPVNIPIYSNNEELSDFLQIFTLIAACRDIGDDIYGFVFIVCNAKRGCSDCVVSCRIAGNPGFSL